MLLMVPELELLAACLMLAGCLLLLAGCEDNKLKQPRERSSKTSSGGSSREGGGIDREFARELAREFGREFAREFAQQLAEGNHSISVPSVASTVSEDAVIDQGGFVDANGDGCWQFTEAQGESNPRLPDSDGDGLMDGAEWGDGETPADTDDNDEASSREKRLLRTPARDDDVALCATRGNHEIA